MSRAWIVILVAIGLLVAVAWLVFRPAEPQPVAYGQPLDYWLNELAARTGPFSYRYPRTTNASTAEHSYAEALAAIGPRAIPFILHKLGTNDSPLLNWYRQKAPTLPAWLVNRIGKPKDITFDTRSAVQALLCLDTNRSAGFPQLMKRLNDRNPAIREVAIQYVAGNYQSFLSFNQSFEIFRRAVKDTDPAVRLYALQALGRLGPDASNAVPELIESLSANENGRHTVSKERWFVRTRAANTLAAMGPSAAKALPALTNLALNGDGHQRTAAAKAIWHISSNLNFALPHLLTDLPTLADEEKRSAIEGLGEIGPLAKSAIPALLTEHARAKVLPATGYRKQELIVSITNALYRIDPRSLAQLGTNQSQ